jgi:hypothetical protein
MLVNALAQVAYGLAQSSRPDLVFGRLLLELPVYFGALWLLLGAYGLVGAAIAWTGRAALDAGLIYALLYRLSLIGTASVLRVTAYCGAGLAAFAVAAVLDGAAVKGVFLLITLALFGVIAWRRVLQPDERERVRGRLRPLWATR